MEIFRVEGERAIAGELPLGRGQYVSTQFCENAGPFVETRLFARSGTNPLLHLKRETELLQPLK